MFYVYILKSCEDQQLYIGSTNNLRKRVTEHNLKKTKSTKFRTPFILVYYETYVAEGDARNREKQLKLRGQARYQLLRRLKLSLLRDQT